MTHIRRHLLLVLAVIFTSLLNTLAVAEAARTVEERWYVMQVGGKPSGWLHESTLESADKRELTSRTDSRISLKRGPTAITIEVATEFVETADGKPLRAVTTTTMGKMKVVQRVTFNADGIAVETQQGTQVTRSTQPLPKEAWMPPAAAGRYVTEQLKKNATKIAFATLEPSADLKPLKIEMTVKGKEDVEVLGKVVPALAVDTTMSNLPGVVTRQYLAEGGRMVKMTMTPIPGFAMTVLLVDKDLAQAQVDPPEVLASTLIEMKTPIKNARNIKRAVYELKFAAPAEGDAKNAAAPSVPKTGYQRVVWGDERTAKVIVDLSEPVAPGDDLPKKEHREANAVLNSDDPKIKELVTEALAKSEKATDREKAEALRKFVHGYIRKKDLSVGFAYASEVARTKQGDCTEHGVLLAAMFRAAGIPSRTVSGLIYVDEFTGKKNIFGYHMWSQAWIKDEKGAGGYWVDFDATLAEPGFDAAHITLGVSAMSDGSLNNDMVKLVPVIGKLEIKVVETK